MAETQTVGQSSQAEDLERLATAAYLLGRDDESEELRIRAHQTFLGRGDRERAAWSAFWLAFGLLQRGARAPASAWLSRAERLLDEAHTDSVVTRLLADACCHPAHRSGRSRGGRRGIHTSSRNRQTIW